MGELRELNESALSVARFTILHLDRVLPDPIVRLNICHLMILQFQVLTGWPSSG